MNPDLGEQAGPGASQDPRMCCYLTVLNNLGVKAYSRVGYLGGKLICFPLTSGEWLRENLLLPAGCSHSGWSREANASVVGKARLRVVAVPVKLLSRVRLCAALTIHLSNWDDRG